MISEFLFYEDDADKSEKSNYIGLKIEIRDLLRDDFNRKILAQILLDLRKDVSGDTQKRLFKLYQDLGLEKDAFKKMRSWRWEVISKGILQLTLMQVEEAYSFIVKFINDSRGTIRKQAEIATVTLKPEGINYFLDTTKYKISEWQQLKLLDVLRNKEDFEPPRFKAWLTSTNKHVVLFALRLIKYYHQNDANATLIELIKHKDQQVRQHAIGCIKEFHVITALPILKGIFWKCTVDTKIAILGAIAELGDSNDIEFLEAVAQREGNFSVKSKAVGAINSIMPESVMPTENIEFVAPYKKPEDKKEVQVKKNPIEADMDKLEQAREDPEIPFSKEFPIPADSGFKPVNDQMPNHELPVIPTPMTDPKKSDKSLKEIEVDVEEVTAASCEETRTTETTNFDISEIHFLPLVVADEKDTKDSRNEIDKNEAISNNSLSATDQKMPADKLNAIDVQYDEISSGPVEVELQALIAEIYELDFLPVVIDEEILPDTDVPDTIDAEATESLENIDGYCLSDFEVSFEEKSDAAALGEDEEVDFDLEDAPIIDASVSKVEDVLSWLMADNELRDIELNYETVPYISDSGIINDINIPAPVYYDEHEAYMMGLLDDLEELGDLREIPLLEELRAEESKSFIKDRIDGMIEKFAQEQYIKRKSNTTSESETADLPVFSVFADLFKNIDTECKLILLDEIVPVGDEKEIEFLDGLLENPDQKIRDKAQAVLKLLIAKLSHENPEALYSKGVSDIVAEHKKVDAHSEEASYDHLLSELDLSPAKAPEIFNIDFELCEVLDKNYDQQILDISVIATEVSPNQNGGSFFNSLRKFSKLF